MAIPPSPKRLFPSFNLGEGGTATVSISDIKKMFPSFEIDPGKKSSSSASGTLELSIDDLRKILDVVLAGVRVDEAWYLSQVPELRRDLQSGKFKSALDHYLLHGYLEGRLPERPIVHEKFYLQENPDIAAAVKSGKIKSAFDHFLRNGYAEGRRPVPNA
jgi:hypothetical protein